MILQIHEHDGDGFVRLIDQREITNPGEIQPWMKELRDKMPTADLWAVMESSPDFIKVFVGVAGGK